MNVTDTGSKHINTKISDCLALVRICALTHTNNTVFPAASSADRNTPPVHGTPVERLPD